LFPFKQTSKHPALAGLKNLTLAACNHGPPMQIEKYVLPVKAGETGAWAGL
jgi:hypothetical protein